MKLTPLDIRHQEFNGAISGYSRRAVRAFLADVSEQVEQLLREAQMLNERIAEQEKRIDEYRHAEDELKRTLVAAERIASEMRASAQKEVELMLREAEADRERIFDEVRNRQHQLEQQYQVRHAELEQQYQARHAELEQQYQARASSIEHEAMIRRTELENSLSRLRSERAQFLAQYRALLQGFGELARHHEAELTHANGEIGRLDAGGTNQELPAARPASARRDADAQATPAPGDDDHVPAFSHQL